MSHPYQYVVLRFVPRVDRGECLNVGIILHSQSAGVLQCSWHLDADRIRAVAPDTDLDALGASLDAVRAVCVGVPVPAGSALGTQGKRFGWLSAPRSTVLQPGPVHGGTCTDPEQEVQRLLELLVR